MRVCVDEELGVLWAARVVSVVDGGRILNVKNARSQIIDGLVMGIGVALFEDVIFDADDHAAGWRGRGLSIILGEVL